MTKQDSLIEVSKWTRINTPLTGLNGNGIADLFKYTFLLKELTKKNIRSAYTKTLLGPLWIILQPVMTTIVFIIVFQKVILIPVQGSSSFVFYSSGIVLWQYFSKSVNSLSNTFISNNGLFSRISFPRIVAPIADISANLFKFTLQYITLVIIYITIFHHSFTIISPMVLVCLIVALFQVSMLAMGLGLITASFRMVFRDMGIMVSYGVNLLFYITPIVFPIHRIPGNIKRLFLLNPMASAVDLFRIPVAGVLSVSSMVIIYGIIVSLVVFLIGLLLFANAQRSCTDKV
jgi:lipopolysaccharide transport system permease protein